MTPCDGYGGDRDPDSPRRARFDADRFRECCRRRKGPLMLGERSFGEDHRGVTRRRPSAPRFFGARFVRELAHADHHDVRRPPEPHRADGVTLQTLGSQSERVVEPCGYSRRLLVGACSPHGAAHVRTGGQRTAEVGERSGCVALRVLASASRQQADGDAQQQADGTSHASRRAHIPCDRAAKSAQRTRFSRTCATRCTRSDRRSRTSSTTRA